MNFSKPFSAWSINNKYGKKKKQPTARSPTRSFRGSLTWGCRFVAKRYIWKKSAYNNKDLCRVVCEFGLTSLFLLKKKTCGFSPFHYLKSRPWNEDDFFTKTMDILDWDVFSQGVLFLHLRLQRISKCPQQPTNPAATGKQLVKPWRGTQVTSWWVGCSIFSTYKTNKCCTYTHIIYHVITNY